MIYVGADLHIERSLRRNRIEVQQDGFNALYKFRDAILQDDCGEKKSVLLAGDVFDKNAVNGSALEAFAEFVDPLWKKGIHTYVIIGNHDGDYGPSILESQGTISLQDKYLKIDGRIVTGLNYAPTEELKRKLTTITPCDILLLHSPFAHLLCFEGSFQCTLEDIPSCATVAVVGDVHVKDFREYVKGRYFISPGALHPCAIDQGNVHGFYKLSAKADIGDWEFCRIPTRQIMRFKISTEADIPPIVSALTSYVPTELKPIVELRHAAKLTLRVHQLELTYKDKFIFIKKPNISGKVLESRRTDLTSKMDLKKFTMLDVLPFAVDPVKDKDSYAFLEALLTTSDPAALLQADLDAIEKDLKDGTNIT